MGNAKYKLNDMELANATVDLFWKDPTKGITELRQFVAEAIAEVRTKSWEAGFKAGQEYIGEEDE